MTNVVSNEPNTAQSEMSDNSRLSPEAKAALDAARSGAVPAPPPDALTHLGKVLYILADLYPDDRCRALDDALAFYNSLRPNEKIGPSGLGYQRLVGPRSGRK